jgi:geranylgeranyl diphosphate synthase type II
MKTIEELQKIIQNEIKNITYPDNPKELYQPISYVLDGTGKNLRPLLTLLSYNMYNNDISLAIKPALGIEMFHNFTLVHDDIMDKAPLRRNKQTIHHKWNENVAILSGDAMMILSFKFFFELPPDIQLNVIKLFTQTALEVCEGQQYDMNFESINDVSLSQYMEMIRLKTAVLIATSLKIGAIIAKAPESDTELLYQSGIKLGLAFQIQDDYLDVYGNTSTFGKNTGNDIVTKKKTFLLINALEKANPEQKKLILETLNSNIEREIKIKTIINLYNELGIAEITKQKIIQLSNESLSLIDKLTTKNKSQFIKQIINELINRNF